MPAADFGHDLLPLGEAAGLEMGVDQVVVEADVKHTPASFDYLGVQTRALADGLLQTCSLRSVVSLPAIGNRDLHLNSFSPP